MIVLWIILGINACFIIPFIVAYIVDMKFLRPRFGGNLEAAWPHINNITQVPILYTQIIPGVEQETMIWNFALFESKGIVVLTLYMKESAKELAIKFLPEDKEEFEAMDENELTQIFSDIYIRHTDATIGQDKSGAWLWLRE